MRRRTKELQRRLEELERELAAMRRATTPTTTPGLDPGLDPAIDELDRRRFLRNAGVGTLGALGALGGAIATAGPAAAADPYDVVKNTSNAVSSTTTLQGGVPGTILALTNTGAGRAITANAAAPSTGTVRAVNDAYGGYGFEGLGSHADFSAARSGVFEPTVDRAAAFAGADHGTGAIFRLGNALTCCVGAGTGSSGTFRTLASAATVGALHPLASPVRCYDSRAGEQPLAGGAAKGPFAPNEARTVDTRNNGTGVPTNALAVLVNLTGIGISAAGFLRAYASNVAQPATSSVNFPTGTAIANTTFVKCGPNAAINVACGGGGSAHAIVDIIGYYK